MLLLDERMASDTRIPVTAASAAMVSMKKRGNVMTAWSTRHTSQTARGYTISGSSNAFQKVGHAPLSREGSDRCSHPDASVDNPGGTPLPDRTRKPERSV